jgi:hypothetical protein
MKIFSWFLIFGFWVSKSGSGSKSLFMCRCARQGMEVLLLK